MPDDALIHGSIRDVNRVRLLGALHEQPGSTRQALMGATGLSRPTISTLLDELERAGIVMQHDDERPRVGGRPPVVLSIVPDAGFAVGVDVGHAHVRVAVCDLSGRILADEVSPAEVDHAPTESLDLARELVRGVLEEAGVPVERVLGVGMALAAPVNGATGTVHAAGILPSWGGLQPAHELSRRLGLPVEIGNDANLGAFGERSFGVARGVDDLVYVRLSAGVGLGLILGGRPHVGTSGIAGELGHVPVDDDGLICRCGKRGCLETIASPEAIARLLARSRGEAFGAERLTAELAGTDLGVLRAVTDAGTVVGRSIATIVNVLNPSLVVLGGDLANVGEPLTAAVRDAIDRHAMAPAAAAVRVTVGSLGPRAEVLGAAALVLAHTPRALASRAQAH